MTVATGGRNGRVICADGFDPAYRDRGIADGIVPAIAGLAGWRGTAAASARGPAPGRGHPWIKPGDQPIGQDHMLALGFGLGPTFAHAARGDYVQFLHRYNGASCSRRSSAASRSSRIASLAF
jgi:hypothetical protein